MPRLPSGAGRALPFVGKPRAAPAPAASQFPTQQESPAETPEELVNRLAALAPGLSNDARWSLSYRLQQAGFAISGALPPPLPSRTRCRSSSRGGSPSRRARRSIASGRWRSPRCSSISVVTMDQVSWSLWKNLAPIHRPARSRRDWAI